jgi:hypothetical protein
MSDATPFTCPPFWNYGSTLGGSMGKGREPKIILNTDERNLVLELGARGNSSSIQAVGMRTKSSSRMTSLRSQSRAAAW